MIRRIIILWKLAGCINKFHYDRYGDVVIIFKDNTEIVSGILTAMFEKRKITKQ